MSDLKNMLDDWRNGVRDIRDNPKSHTNDLLHEVWTPRWNFFQPPLWKIFKWAYKIKRTLYTNCYPVSIPSSEPTSHEPIISTFTPVTYDVFEERIQEMMKNPEDYIEPTRLRKTLIWPSSLSDFIDVIFSHNEIIALWYDSQDDDGGYNLLYRGEAWALPEEYSKLTAIKIFGVICDQVSENDSINILVEINNDTKFDLHPVYMNEEYKKARRGGLSDAEISE